MGTTTITPNALDVRPSIKEWAKKENAGGFDLKIRRVAVAMGSTYATGGDTCDIAAAVPEFGQIFSVMVCYPMQKVGSAWYMFVYDPANKKMLAFVGASDSTEVWKELSNGSNALASTTVQCLVIGV